MAIMLEKGVKNILCVQPFGCLPNHITGRGVLKELKRRHPDSNIVAVDYDPGASEVNQLNRIKLLMSVARSRADRGTPTRRATAPSTAPLFGFPPDAPGLGTDPETRGSGA
jgi:predicted nucleotide-binding protein (sugar kinase/HSP70/actin superfamily)